MFARRILTLGAASAAFAACLGQAALGATGSAPVRVNLVQTTGITVDSALTLPSVTVAPVMPSSSVTTSAAAASAAVSAVPAFNGSTQTQRVQTGSIGNAQLTIRGQPGDTVSTTVPESFTVVRSGGQETLTVKTNTNAEYQIGSGDVVLGGALMNGNTMSVDIGGALNLASAQNLVPGPYEGMLVVVVQYN